MNGEVPDASFWEWIIGITSTVIITIFGYTHKRITDIDADNQKIHEVLASKVSHENDKIWEVISVIQRDFREVATKNDLVNMERRIMEAIHKQ